MTSFKRFKAAQIALLFCALGALASACNSTLGLSDYEATDLSRCDDELVDFDSDPANCGACGQVCSGGSACVLGKCECPAGEQFCDGVCANLDSDVDNCGTCGTECAAGASCTRGEC